MSANGQLSSSELGNIPGGRLRKDAAAAFNAMYAEHPVHINDSYRPLGAPGDLGRGVWSQWAAWERYQRGGNLAAQPGTSNHGWGTAIDLASEADRATIDRIGAEYGFSKSWSDAQTEWWHILYQPGHWNGKPAKRQYNPNAIQYGDGPRLAILTLTRRLKLCGWIGKAYWNFNSQVHGAVCAFQRYHHLTVDGVIGPATHKAINDAAARCKKTKRMEH